MPTTHVILKSLTPLLLALPVGGYAVGSLAASSADDDTPRQTIQLEQAGPASAAPAAHERRHHHATRHAGTTSGPAVPAGAGDAAAPTEAGEASESGDSADDSAGATSDDHVETIVPRYHESGPSGAPEPEDEATTPTTRDDGDDQGGDDGSGDEGDRGSDRRGDHSDDSDQDGGGD